MVIDIIVERGNSDAPNCSGCDSKVMVIMNILQSTFRQLLVHKRVKDASLT